MTTRDELAARRFIEDQAVNLGCERAVLEAERATLHSAAKELLAEALAGGLSIAEIARLTGFSRQTLHAWRRESE